jgi:putative endonuclease
VERDLHEPTLKNPGLSVIKGDHSMPQRYYTYVLRSERDEHVYIGFTSDLRKRVDEHNKGKVRSTKSRRPLSLVFYEEYEDKTLGRKREIFLKSGQGRLYLKNRLKE